MRNILLFIDDVKEAGSLGRSAFKIARQSRANLHLCNVAASVTKRRLLVSHVDDDILLDDNEGLDSLARELTMTDQPEGAFVPTVTALEISGFNPQIVSETVINNDIWLIIISEQQLNPLKNTDAANNRKMINDSNCPVLIMPQHIEPGYFNRISYVTDLRYCDLGVMQFLKTLNAQIFVTHISAPGLPDMEERYAQGLLAEEISTKVNYSKMFLRNIKNQPIKEAIDHIVDTQDIKIIALVNKKHQTYERLFGEVSKKKHLYHNVPALIFPYHNWFHKASFYA